MNDLMAIATVRRILFELGWQLMPEAPGGLVGPLSVWIAQPHENLAGLSPLQVLAGPAGEERVRELLSQLISKLPAPGHHPGTGLGALP